MSEQKEVSVIIPVYNAERYLKFCIESVLDEEFELILIDDGSTDNSRAIITEYRDRYPNNIRTIFQQNSGVSEARNVGIQKSTGSWLFFLDADDYLTKDGVKIIKSYIKSDADIINFSFQRVVDHDFKISLGSHKEKEFITSTELINQALRGTGYSELNSQHNFRSSCGKLIKKDILLTQSFDKNIYIGEDFVFMLDLYANVSNIIIVDSSLYCYFCNSNSAVNGFHKDYFKNVIRVNEQIEAILRSKKLFECNDIKESFDFYKMNDLMLLLKYDYYNSENKITWKIRKKSVKKVIELMDFSKLYEDIKRDGNVNQIPKKKRIIYCLLFMKFYYLVYIIFKIKYARK